MGYDDRDRYEDRDARDRRDDDRGRNEDRERYDDRSRYDERGSRSRKRGSSPCYDGPRKERRSGSIIKVLCPYYNAGSIIGRGGEAIKAIKEKTGVKIDISKHEARFPGTEERVVTIQGECEQIQEAVRFVQEKIRSDSEPASARSYDEDINERRRKTCKLVVADAAMARLIGKGGENIKEMKTNHGVQINTSKRDETPIDLEERIISIEGEERDIESCAFEIIEDICSDSRISMKHYIDYAELNNRDHMRRPDGKFSYRDEKRGGRDHDRDRGCDRDRDHDRDRGYDRDKRNDYDDRRRNSRDRDDRRY